MVGAQEPSQQDPVEELALWLGQLRNSRGRPSYKAIIAEVRRNDPTSSLAESTLSNAFNGKTMPTYDTVIAIARALGGAEAAREADGRYTEAGNQRDAIARAQKRQTSLAPSTDTPVSQSVPAAAAQATVGEQHVADLVGREQSSERKPDPAGGEEPGGQKVWQRLPPLARAAVVVGSVVAVAAAGTAAVTGMLSGSPDSHQQAAGSSSSSGAARGAAASAGTPSPANHGGASKDPNAWSGRPPIAVQATVTQPMCGAAYFEGTSQEYLAQLQPGGAPPAQAVLLGAPVQVTIQGRTEQSVLLTGMRLTVTSRKNAPAKGITVGYGQCGGGVSERRFDIDLSKTPPTWKAKPARDDFTDEVTAPAVVFPYKISLTDPEVFNLTTVKGCGAGIDCTFTIDLVWVADGKTGHTTVDNNGTGFRDITPTGLPRYRQDSDGAGPTLLPQPG
ncbi:helix-turn-helix domain-containing protein [Streptomyces sp. NPDC001315]|uniref:helix-turn-helix domain-containing protein n=1 Tax=Streptomyces sp. NPDC001315 TaxID=3364562 RepID=UPI00368E3075